MDPEQIARNREAMSKRMGKQATKIGGAARRKKKTNSRTSGGNDDKKLSAQLKRLAANQIPGIEEVNMFRDDGTVIHFKNPKVHASPMSNTFAISGQNEVKQITEMLPDVLRQLGMDGIAGLQEWAKEAKAKHDAANGSSGIPELSGNFDDDLE